MKKLLCIYISLMLTFSVAYQPMTVTATGNSDNNSVTIADVADLWGTLLSSGKLYVGTDGLFHLRDNEYQDHAAYEHLLIVIEECNYSISAGIIYTTNTGDVLLEEEYNVDIEYKLVDNEDFRSTEFIINSKDYPDYSTYALGGGIIYPTPPDWESHTCSEQHIALIDLCEENYQTLARHLNSMLTISILNSNLDAYMATIIFWINKVKVGGEWDYKVSDEYGPYNNILCTCYQGAYRQITAEFLGNFNYGYTGSLLFNLDILHFGSSLVSGFDPADQADWPAIDEGYNLKCS